MDLSSMSELKKPTSAASPFRATRMRMKEERWMRTCMRGEEGTKGARGEG